MRLASLPSPLYDLSYPLNAVMVEPASHEMKAIYYVPMFRAVLQYLYPVPVEEVDKIDFHQRKAWVVQRQKVCLVTVPFI